jgi:hypothetical protein
MHALSTLVLLAALLIQTTAPQGAARERRSGPVRVSGRAVADNGGEFAALGASLFWAAWAYKNDRPRLDAHLKLLADHNFHYIRALGVVGRQPYWAGREIDWRWPDYDQVIAGLTDHAYDQFGLRVQWTIFADAEQVIPDPADRVRLVDRFLKMSAGREQKIMHFEVANESWQNGFGGPDGIRQIRELTTRLASRTEIPVAISDSEGHECADHLALYRDMPVEILTEHFARDLGGPLKSWGPVAEPWSARSCPGLPPVISNNEPVGPRSSVESETDPHRIVAAAVSSYMASVGLYVFHTDAGVWGREPIEKMPNARAILGGFAAMSRYVPGDIVTWRRHRRDSPEHVFRMEGGVEIFASVERDGLRFFAMPVGIEGGATLEARRAMQFEVLDLLSGAVLEKHDLEPGEKIVLKGRPVVVVTGRLAK